MSEFKIGDKVGFLGMEGRLVYTSDLACTIIVPGAGFSTISDSDWGNLVADYWKERER